MFLILLFMGLNSNANSIELEFNNAKSLLANKKYVDALTIYKKIERDGNYSTNLYLNMANAENRLGDVSASLLYLERARKFTTDKQEIDNNIAQIVSANHLEYEREQATFMAFMAEQITLQWWYKLMFIVAFGLILFLLIYKFKNKEFSLIILGTSSFIYVIFILFIYTIIYTKQQSLKNHDYAIVMSMTCSLKNAPNILSSTNYEVTEGSKFLIKDKIGNWYLLQNQFGKKGWTELKNIGLI
ncbi:MAG: hypothetical protein WCP57_03510 [Bacteroidota bacterium]